MKQSTLLVLSFLFFATMAHAQFAKGDRIITGSFSHNYSSGVFNNIISLDGQVIDRNDVSSSFSLNLSMGFFKNERVAFGLGATIGTFSSENNGFRNNSVSLSLLPFMRHYVSLNQKFSLFGHLSTGATLRRTVTKMIPSGDQIFKKTELDKRFFINYMVGLSYRALNWLSVEATANLASYDLRWADNIGDGPRNLSSRFTTSPKFNLLFGITLNLPQKEL